MAEFGQTYVPPSIPPGYIYIRWQVQVGSADVFGNRLLIEFGKHGKVIQWHVEISADPKALSYDDCGRRQPFDRRVRIGARTIYYMGLMWQSLKAAGR